jgi:hypothetical protein
MLSIIRPIEAFAFASRFNEEVFILIDGPREIQGVSKRALQL